MDPNNPPDKAHDAARTASLAAAAMIPVVGGAAAVMLAEVWQSTYQRRVERLVEEIGERLSQVEADLQLAAQRDEVATAAAIAIRYAPAAIDEKLSYLANAVANVATDESLSNDVATTLVTLVGETSATQIDILSIIDDPNRWESKTGRKVEAVERDGLFFDNLAVCQALGVDVNDYSAVEDVEMLITDIEAKDLITTSGLGAPAGSSSFKPFEHHLSNLGERLLRFVRWSPPVPPLPTVGESQAGVEAVGDQSDLPDGGC